jgi:hypothetical protein
MLDKRATNQSLRCLAVTIALFLSSASLPTSGRQGIQYTNIAHQRSAPPRDRFTLTFTVKTAPGLTGGQTDDLITIAFSDVSANVLRPPLPLFADSRAEFSFSGLDARASATLIFERRVPDIEFLDSNFVRVFNHGSDGWSGESLTMANRADAKSTIVFEQSLYPRAGWSRDGGIEKFNRRDWSKRVYWEADLRRIRKDSPSGR